MQIGIRYCCKQKIKDFLVLDFCRNIVALFEFVCFIGYIVIFYIDF